MKTRHILAAVSLIALMTSTAAYADTEGYGMGTGTEMAAPKPAAAKPKPVRMSNMSLKQAWRNSPDNAGEKVQAQMLGSDSSVHPAPLSLDRRMTATGMIGRPVYNEQRTRVGTVKDIILDKEGNARLIVVSNSTFLGFGGKLAALDYDSVVDRTKDGDVITPVTEKSMTSLAEFSYDIKDAGKKDMRVIPENGYSIAKLLDGNLISPTDKKIAAIDNITLRNGKAALVIAAYNQVLEMGGRKVALSFDSTQLIQDKNNVNLKLSQAQTDQLQDFEKADK